MYFLKNLFSNVNPTVFSWSAVIIGTILCEELNTLEQNSIGNWIILLGDYLLTNAAQVAINEANQNQNNDDDDKIQSLQKAIKRIDEELEKLKNIDQS